MIDYNFFNFLLEFFVPVACTLVLAGFLFEIGKWLGKMLTSKKGSGKDLKCFLVCCENFEKYEEEIEKVNISGAEEASQ